MTEKSRLEPRSKKLIPAEPGFLSIPAIALLALLAGRLLENYPLWAAVFAFMGLASIWIAFDGRTNCAPKRGTKRAAACSAFIILAAASWNGARPKAPELPLGILLTFKGKISKDPKLGDAGPSIIAELEAFAPEAGGRWTPIEGKVYVRILGNPEPFPAMEDAVLFRGKLRPPKGLLNPGTTGFTEYLASKGIGGRAVVKWPGEISFAAPGMGASMLMGWRRRMSAAITEATPGQSGEVLRALALGDRSGLSPETIESFRSAGTAHLLAISGLHLGLLSLLLTPLFRAFLVRIPKLPLLHPIDSLAPALTIPALIAFAALSGFQTSTVRALVMVCLMIAGTNASRASSPITLLCSTAVLMALPTPAVLGDQGFHLSMAALAGLFWLAPLIERRLVRPKTLLEQTIPQNIPSKIGGAAASWWMKGLSASLAAALTTLPVAMFHFGSASAAGLAVNPIAVPLMVFLCLPSGLLGVFFYGFWRAAGRFFWGVSAMGIDAIIAFQNSLAAHAPNLKWAAVQTPSGLLGAGLFLIWFGLFLKRRGTKRSSLTILSTGIVLLFAVPTQKAYSLKADSRTHLWALDVGQAQALAIQLPRNKWILVDGAGVSDDAFDMGEKTVIPALKALGAKKLTLAVSTHPHPDHLNGLISSVRWGKPEILWLPETFYGDKRYAELTEIAASAGSSIFWIGDKGIDLEIEGVQIKGITGKGPMENDRSLVLRISHHGSSMILPADLETKGQQALLASKFPLDCDILAAPHHGAKSSLHKPFLEAASPKAVLISAGGRPGLPSEEFIQGAKDVGAKVYSTHTSGILHAILDKRGATIETPLSPLPQN